MEIDVGLDAVGLPHDMEAEITADAARRGYGRIWTASGGDPFQTCGLRWAATRAVVRGGIGTAVGVVPVTLRSPADLAISGAALSRLTGGRFILGVGAGSAYQSSYRRTWGVAEPSPLALVRAYLTTMHAFLGGERVTYHGSGVNYDDAALPNEPAVTPLYLGAGGPEMVRLGGELADGVYLSWCTDRSVASTRSYISEGAARVGRDPSQIRLAASVRVCIDDALPVARRALAEALLPYVLGWNGAPPSAYRTQFERMGFGHAVAEVDKMRERGIKREGLIEAFPDEMLSGLGYYGPSSGAADAVRRIAGGADIAVVRVVPAQPGTAAILAILDACQPGQGAR